MKYLITENDLEVLDLVGPSLLSILGFEEEEEDTFGAEILLTAKDGTEYVLSIVQD